jgi:hypothetical protein
MRALRITPLLIGLLLLAPLAESRTLTAADGRTIEADVLGFEGTDKVQIRRTDTDRTFTLPIASFAEADRKALLAEAEAAAKKAAILPDGAIVLELSRAKFDTRREKQDIPLSDGTVRKNGITITEEDWGFGIGLRNTTHRPVEGLRCEYVLFLKRDNPGSTAEDKKRLYRKRHKLVLDPIPPSGRIAARSTFMTARKTELASGIVWSGTGEAKTRDTLHGIWVRIYQGDKLVLESASPGTLATTEKWEAADVN